MDLPLPRSGWGELTVIVLEIVSSDSKFGGRSIPSVLLFCLEDFPSSFVGRRRTKTLIREEATIWGSGCLWWYVGGGWECCLSGVGQETVLTFEGLLIKCGGRWFRKLRRVQSV